MASMADRPRAGNLYSLLAAVVLISREELAQAPELGEESPEPQPALELAA